MSTNAKRLIFAIIMAVAVAWAGQTAHALRAPHDGTGNITKCGQCHSRVGAGWRTRTSFNSLCFNSIGCHRTTGSGNFAKKKSLSMRDASDRFGSISVMQRVISDKKQSSHGWKIPNKNSNAGVPDVQYLTEAAVGYPSYKIYCTRCHRAMGDIKTEGAKYYPKFLRADPTGNYVCFKCHSARRISNVSEPRQAGLDYSHPVEVNYSTARATKPDFFNATFRLGTGYDESARVRLYTTHESAQADGRSRLAGKNKGAVVCQSCHGPMHSADSNPYTFDNLSAWSWGTVNYSSSAGNLLRTYPIAGLKASNKLCLSCHNVQAHKGFLCGRCHTPHKKPNENNRYLILENISTPSNGKRSVAFTSRSEMAARFAAGYSSALSRLNPSRQVSNRICQVCHTATSHHRNYSSPGGTVDRTHNIDVNNKYFFCPNCHKHTSGFTPSGCSTCHNFPPSDANNFKHGKHTNSSVEPIPTNTFWKTGRVTDNRSDSSYGFSCGRCHSPWAPYTAPGGDGYQGKNHYGIVSPSNNYTTDIGFKVKTSINSLPWNPSGTYLYNGTGRILDGTGSQKWWGAGTGAECRNLYCHGQWYNGYTSNNPQARGTQPCGSCHGASNTDPPGNTGGASNNYGAHPRHVGSANSQQYGSGEPNFRCNACHSLTSKYNNETTISSRKYHVNGKVNIKFDNGSSSNNFRVGNGSSNYGGYPGGYNGYTSRRPASFIRPAYTTCSLIYCHSRGNRIQGSYSAPNNAGIGTGSSRFPNWSSSRNFTTTMSIYGYSMKTRCARCHGNATYRGITMAMPNYTGIAYGGAKENSHRKHVIENKFRCNVCHSSTINSANNSIANTQNHVNRFYNISIISTYRKDDVGNNYDDINKKCSSITCHAGKTTPAWGSKIGCPDCHLSNTGDVDKRIKVGNTFQSFSETAPRIYSTQWADTGHGRSSATQYPSGTNYGANKVCTNCHSASVAHGTSNNPFRLYTAPGRPNRVCEGCHGTSPWVGGASRQGIQTHASSVVQTGKFNFAIKCIDCHDPHGDNNSRFMVHSTVARPLITGTRAESSNQYGQRLTNVTSSNVDFVNNQYTSDYAKKIKSPKICQVCHTRTVDRDPSSPTYLKGRFRWYSGSDKAHGSGKCTSCHSHGAGFKGAGCNGCHGFPPIGRFNVLSGQGRTLANLENRQRPSGNPSNAITEAATAGAHQKHYGNFSGTYASSKQTICSFCHQGGMYATGSISLDIEVGFKPFPDYTGSTQKYTGQAAVRNGYYGYSGIGIATGDTMRCTVKCHGGENWLTSSLGNYTEPKWDVSQSVRCGKCHGAKKGSGVGSWPTSNRHQKHAGYPSGTGYDFMCRVCHADTVMGTATTLNKTNHVNGQATFKFYTGTFTGNRVWSQSNYTGGDTKVNSGFGWCKNLYCHSRGTTTSPAYDTLGAYPNYTAKWTASNLPASATEKCSYCHGSKKSTGGYAGITSAMPNQADQAHKKHVIDNGFKCNFCHSATVDSSNAIISVTNHVNKFKNISIISSYRTGQTMYSSSLSSTNKTCKNIRCHAGRKTPNWTVSYDSIKCTDCHYQSSGAANSEDNFAWTNFSGNNSVAAKIYSTEWAGQGHGRARANRYAFSNNSGAARTCTNCHKPAVKHGDANNYFRLMTSNPDRLCLACHGLGSERIPAIGFSRITGIQSHTWANISTAGYVSAANGGNKRKAAIDGGWNFGDHDSTDKKKVKCVDCHDPHGDGSNNYMMHSFPNFSGSDRVGRPTYTATGMQMTFSTVGGPQMNWSSYVKPTIGALGICQRCHTPMTNTTAMTNFNKGKYSDHNSRNRCTKCHKHGQGFKPSGCDGCHGYPPPAGPDAPYNWTEDLGSPNTYGLHEPHAKNPRSRPGITPENNVAGAAGFNCNRCHANTADGADSTMGSSNNKNAIMTQLENSVYGNWTANSQPGYQSVTDDTCSRITCHTPRYYIRQWTKPTDCDDCHGYRNKTETAAGAFKIQTTGSHKIHVNYSTPGIAGTDFKKYGLRCSNCHYDWQTLNNYSTHYSSYVNITANGPVNTIAKMKIKDGQFYTKGRLFEGYTTGNESFGTCAKAYCHGNFTNGTTGTLPNWKKGVSPPVTCTSCHKGRLTFTNGSTMPERHQKHVKTNQYGFACVRCHVRTTNNITTIIFNYSSHVNGRKDVYFNNQGGIDNTVGSFNPVVSSRQCSNTYCHSKGYRSTGTVFTTRTTLANYTADWDITAEGRAGTGKGCSFCHGNKTYNGITAAMPNYTANWGNSHRTHVIGNKFRCNVCHSATVNAAGRITTYGNHVNGFKNISIIVMYKSGQTLYSTNATATQKMTCKNVKCHAGKTTPKWGTSANCKNCHFVAAGSDTDDYANFRSFTGTAAKIYSTEWASKGHGSVGKNIQCTNCHKATAPHDGKDGSGNVRNPYRLLTSQSVALCGNCHGTSSERSQWNSNGEYIASVYQDIKPHTSADTNGDAAWNTHSTAQGRSVKCIDCHDPHGDKNKKMIHALINMSGSDRFGRPKGRPWGDGSNSAVTAQMTFTSHGPTQQLIWSSFANGNASDVGRSICRRCHTPNSLDGNMGNVPVGNEGRMTKDNYAVNHQPHVSKCTSCHQHTKGFKGAKCDSCHGFPPTGTFNLLSGAGRTNEIKQRGSGNATIPGAHGRHSSVLLQGQAGGDRSTLCNFCHSGGMSTTGSDDGNITIKFGAGTFAQYTVGLYKGQDNVKNGYYNYSGYPGMKSTTNNTMRCENVKCHGAQGNWLTKSFGNPTAPKWNDTTRSTVFCGSCHGAKKSTAVASTNTWPTTKAHALHAGTDAAKQQNLMCRVCHGSTVLGTATTLSKSNHVNAAVLVKFTSDFYKRVDGNSTYLSGGTEVNATFGKCWNTYCHSQGSNKVAPYNDGASQMNFTATWNDAGQRGSYTKGNGQKAKCNYCHGNKSWSGVTSAMPNYPNDSPKANKHPKHVREYNFLCNSCHNNVVANNTSIQGGNYSLHVNRSYNVNFNNAPGGRTIENAQGSYTSTGSKCESTYCHSRGVDLVSSFSRITTLANYTAKWGDTRGGINIGNGSKPNMTRCNYCHGNGAAGGSVSAAPNYANNTPKANRHPMHVNVTTYGFTCTACHNKVTTNGTSIDAAGGRDRHVNKAYNINFSNAAPFAGNTGTYTYLTAGSGSKCKNTYCHSRGTDRVAPYNTRTSLSNFTAAWGDTRNGYSQAKGVKAKCNYCHGNRLFSGITAAMPNYTSAATNTAKWNTHPLHVRGYGFTCTVCHVKVTSNNTSIDAAGGKALHVNMAYNVNFKANVRGSLTNNTGVYSYTDLTTKSRCRNTYCHSRGTDFAKPYNTRTSLSNFTAAWGDSRGNGGYKQAKGVKAKCNYCHGNRAYSGMTSAMPNYSGNFNGTPLGVTAKANSHRKHVLDNGFVCSTCHYGVVRNNTSISDRLSHVNGFYNISITPAKKAAAGKAYSTNWADRTAGGTCMNVTCHGTSKPKWGNPSTANCKTCHFKNSDDDQYAVVNDTAAGIYSTEWKKKGHGKFDAFTSKSINRCERCHKASVAHNYAQSPLSNPFRLYTLQADALCANCHGTSAERNKTQWGGVGNFVVNQYTGILTHSKANTSGNAKWNTHSSVTGKGAKCIDCHDPHGDKNKKMIHLYINHSGSDRFGRPAGPPWDTLNTNTKAMMTFTSHGPSQQIIWSSFVNNNRDRSICRRCHTPKAQEPNLAIDMSKENYADTHQNHTEKCTVKCHMHKTGFKPTGESQGNEDCSGCHGTGDLFEKMKATNNYHHVMINTSATGSPKYPTVSSFGPNGQKNSARRCLMCHVDHNIFRPDINTDGTGGRAKNLRWSVFDKGNTGINTDFWPAKRKNATGRTGLDLGSGNYSSTYPISGPSTFNGICISCHKNVQYKNTTLVNDDIQVQRARPFSINLYTSSSHNFQVISSTFAFGSGNSKTRFRGNCTKCHRTPDNDFNALSKSGAQSGRFPVALHDKNVPSLLMNIATSSSKPKIEQLCFNCHSTDPKAAGGPGMLMDFYSSIRMNSGAKMIKTALVGKKYVKPIEDVGMAGRHKIDEYYKASDSTGYNSNPGVLWNYSTGAAGGVGRHVECVDCHNTHGGNASIRRIVGAPFRGDIRDGRGLFNHTSQKGNMISGAQKGVWGVSLSYDTTRGTTPAFTKVAQVSYQYEVCLKCHSRYAYGLNPPGVPSGLPDPAGATVASYDNLGASVPQADISRLINPNNYGYHPIYKKGRNQPPKGANTNWPSAGKSNWMYKDRFTNRTAFISVSGLSWNFVPPFSQHSLLACTDCHTADNTGNAIGKFSWQAATQSTGWNNVSQSTLGGLDGVYANRVGGANALEIRAKYEESGYPANPVDNVFVVAYGCSDSSSANRKDSTLGMYSGATPTLIGTSTVAGTPLCTSAASPRVEADIGIAATRPWTRLNDSDRRARFTPDSGNTGTIWIDYLGYEALYKTTADVRGPHGSMERWLLTDLDREIWFDADNSDTLDDTDADKPNRAVGGTTANQGAIFCWNCHRRDIYTYEIFGTNLDRKNFARVLHSAEDLPFEVANQMGIACLNCHGGGAPGEIHGSFASQTTIFVTSFATPASRLLTRPRGVRLLNGAMLNFNPTTNGCYTPTNTAGTPYGGACSGGHTGDKVMTTNYTYTSW